MSIASSVSCIFLGLLLLLPLSNAVDPKIGIYMLKRGDFQIKLTNYGATIMSFVVPDKHGNLTDIVLGFDSIDSYKNDSVYFGALVGRVANRIGGAHFSMNGQTYKLPANDGNNTLHGGSNGFSDVVWTVASHKIDSHITFTYASSDNEQGFPGKLVVSVSYMFFQTNKLIVKMEAKPIDHPTPVNLAQHSYWNLRGHNSGDILSHTIQIFASQVTPVNAELIPTGELKPVAGTPYDFLEAKEIGSHIHEVGDGYDINYDSVSGRKMELWSNQVGVQFYTSNMLKDVKGKGGATYQKHGGFCLETQGFPDSVNHPNFPSQIVYPGQRYQHLMVYRFTAE
ncbi:aldose 1-epimerase-like [Senna tora]|uniref:Aldose 1-epimerase n=1 Tax=Senna tora TaxID=362788 RepID=A0A834X4G1_9FABA|nr:aldose 1-epimerase-like [Senna tora]